MIDLDQHGRVELPQGLARATEEAHFVPFDVDLDEIDAGNAVLLHEGIQGGHLN